MSSNSESIRKNLSELRSMSTVSTKISSSSPGLEVRTSIPEQVSSEKQHLYEDGSADSKVHKKRKDFEVSPSYGVSKLPTIPKKSKTPASSDVLPSCTDSVVSGSAISSSRSAPAFTAPDAKEQTPPPDVPNTHSSPSGKTRKKTKDSKKFKTVRKGATVRAFFKRLAFAFSNKDVTEAQASDFVNPLYDEDNNYRILERSPLLSFLHPCVDNLCGILEHMLQKHGLDYSKWEEACLSDNPTIRKIERAVNNLKAPLSLLDTFIQSQKEQIPRTKSVLKSSTATKVKLLIDETVPVRTDTESDDSASRTKSRRGRSRGRSTKSRGRHDSSESSDSDHYSRRRKSKHSDRRGRSRSRGRRGESRGRSLVRKSHHRRTHNSKRRKHSRSSSSSSRSSSDSSRSRSVDKSRKSSRRHHSTKKHRRSDKRRFTKERNGDCDETKTCLHTDFSQEVIIRKRKRIHDPDEDEDNENDHSSTSFRVSPTSEMKVVHKPTSSPPGETFRRPSPNLPSSDESGQESAFSSDKEEHSGGHDSKNVNVDNSRENTEKTNGNKMESDNKKKSPSNDLSSSFASTSAPRSCQPPPLEVWRRAYEQAQQERRESGTCKSDSSSSSSSSDSDDSD